MVVLSSCEAEFMAGTEAVRQAIWLQGFLSEGTGQSSEKVVIRIDNKSATALTRNLIFHGRSNHIDTHKVSFYKRVCGEWGSISITCSR